MTINNEATTEEPPRTRGCGTDQVHLRLLLEDAQYAQRRALIEDRAFRATQAPPPARIGVATIPVVVHVVYRKAAENISRAQIESQLDVLNEDFRKRNGDVSTVPSAFSGRAADARIQFELATLDPNGDPTDGITRTQTSVREFGLDDTVKFASHGGISAWPADVYLNMWVCVLGGGYLGYAQFPGGPPATDGVVVTHTCFGNTGTAEAPFDGGRTATHEVGHWLNLRHIWGDDFDGCSGSDFVSDTPNQGGPNFGEPTFPTVSCGNGPNGDLFMNYMDYVDDAAMVMFTAGQSSRMDAALNDRGPAIGPPGKPRIRIRLRGVSGGSKLRVNLAPNQPAWNYRFRVQKRVNGAWKTVKTLRTQGWRDLRIVDLPRGKYRVKVPSQHGLKGGTSKSVRLGS
jgi:hypothetical protein